MKNNAFTKVCALLTLAVSMLLGAIFGVTPHDAARAGAARCAVASSLE